MKDYFLDVKLGTLLGGGVSLALGSWWVTGDWMIALLAGGIFLGWWWNERGEG